MKGGCVGERCRVKVGYRDRPDTRNPGDSLYKMMGYEYISNGGKS
jgi:hypothetical protein